MPNESEKEFLCHIQYKEVGEHCSSNRFHVSIDIEVARSRAESHIRYHIIPA